MSVTSSDSLSFLPHELHRRNYARVRARRLRGLCRVCGERTHGVREDLDDEPPGHLCDTCWVEMEFELSYAASGFVAFTTSDPKPAYGPREARRRAKAQVNVTEMRRG